LKRTQAGSEEKIGSQRRKGRKVNPFFVFPRPGTNTRQNTERTQDWSRKDRKDRKVNPFFVFLGIPGPVRTHAKIQNEPKIGLAKTQRSQSKSLFLFFLAFLCVFARNCCEKLLRHGTQL
jgi:hypothetical protein